MRPSWPLLKFTLKKCEISHDFLQEAVFTVITSKTKLQQMLWPKTKNFLDYKKIVEMMTARQSVHSFQPLSARHLGLTRELGAKKHGRRKLGIKGSCGGHGVTRAFPMQISEP